jgi:hypothetical protein
VARLLARASAERAETKRSESLTRRVRKGRVSAGLRPGGRRHDARPCPAVVARGLARQGLRPGGLAGGGVDELAPGRDPLLVHVPAGEPALEAAEETDRLAGVVLGEVDLRQVEAHQDELLAEARLAEVVPGGGEAALGGVEAPEAAADLRLEPGEGQARLALAAEQVEGSRAFEEVERLPAEPAVVQKPDEGVASGELRARLAGRVEELEGALGEAHALGGIVVADDEGDLDSTVLLPVAGRAPGRRS